MSEEELVSPDGRRVGAAFAHVSTERFSKQFTDRYEEIADASPVFAELQSLFDLAVLAALMKKERLPARVDWSLSLFLDPQRATIVKRNVPRQTESISNYKRLNRGLYIAQVTGGVTLDPFQLLLRNEYRADAGGKLTETRNTAAPAERPKEHAWWWD
jgi:hypothetical protein